MTSATNPHARRLVLLPRYPDARPHAVFSSAWGHPLPTGVRAQTLAPALLGREARKPSHSSRPGFFIQER
jgi:hypothetical protein